MTDPDPTSADLDAIAEDPARYLVPPLVGMDLPIEMLIADEDVDDHEI